tara:strand:- start:4197 stop:4373 length:177 start_codon:yes stop_codon:yes gene_type:complete
MNQPGALEYFKRLDEWTARNFKKTGVSLARKIRCSERYHPTGEATFSQIELNRLTSNI